MAKKLNYVKLKSKVSLHKFAIDWHDGSGGGWLAG